MKRLATPLMAVAIFLLNLWLNAPLFMPGELPFRGSIEHGYVGMARFVAAHPNPWGWNPLPYCGLPTQFMYVPALPYFTAIFIRLLPEVSPDFIYRVIVSLFTCLGPVTLFLFAVYFTGSRRWSFAAAVAYSLISPSYMLFPAVDQDRGLVQLPWRIQLLAKYGEGPHNTGLALLPLALLALWRAAKTRAFAPLFLAALLLALVPLVNFVAAMGLAISCLLLLLAAWGEPGFRYWRVAAAGMLAYLLACFWLTPGFVRTIAFNWPVDSFSYHLQRRQTFLLIGVALGAVIVRLLFRFRRGSFYFCFVTLAAFVFGWIATAYYVYGIDTIPESRRYTLEFELFLALAIAEAIRLTVRSPNQTVRLCAVGTAGVILLVGAPQVFAYLTQGWSRWRPQPVEKTVEYQLASWIAEHPPRGRVFASGGLRFRLHSWLDIPQVGGAFETGLHNRVPVDLAYRIRSGHSTGETLKALEDLGAEYVVVHGPKSREYYRDFQRPERLAGLQVVHRIEDDTIYALPAKPLQWTNPSTLVVAGAAGTPVSVRVNAHPGWQAIQDGREIAIGRDHLGFMILRPSSAAPIELRFRGTAEQKLMAGISVLVWLAALAILIAAATTGKRLKT